MAVDEFPSLSKIVRPATDNVLYRERLFAVLDQFRERPLTWVSSSPGSGKTTLLSSYIESRRLEWVWYEMDQGDHDVANFFYYLGLAAQKAKPDKKESLPHLTPEFSMGIERFSLQFFENFFTRFDSSTLIVFDNFQTISDDFMLHQLILDSISRLPDNVRIALISRNEHPAVYSRLKANRQMNVFGWENLRLDREEFSRIAAMLSAGKLPGETVEILYQKLEGWIAGLVLIAERVKMEEAPPDQIPGINHDDIQEYFTSEIWARMGTGLRDFLLKTSFLQKMTPGMARELTGNDSADRILKFLSRNNLFTQVFHLPEPQFQYHSLFRDFLQHRATIECDTEKMQVLRLKAAKLLSESGQHEASAALMIESRSWDELTRFIMEHGPRYLQQGRHRTLMGWLDAMPEQVADNNPWLLYWSGVCQLLLDPFHARPCFSKAFKIFSASDEVPGMFLACSGVMDSYIYAYRGLKPLDRWMKLADQLMRKREFTTPDVELRLVSSMLNAMVYRGVFEFDLESLESRFRKLLESVEDPQQKLTYESWLFLHYFWRGETAKVRELWDGIESATKDSKTTPLIQIYLHVLRSHAFCFFGTFREMLEETDKGLVVAHDSGIHILDDPLLTMGAITAFSMGLMEKGFENLRVLREKVGSSQYFTLAFHSFVTAWGHMGLNDFNQAHDFAKKGMEYSEKCGSLMHQLANNYTCAIVLIELGKYDEANLHISKIRSIAKSEANKFAEVWFLVCQAYLALKKGLRNETRSRLRKLMSLARESGLKNFVGCTPEFLFALCARALQEGIEVEYVQEVVRRRNIIPVEPLPELEYWPWPVKIYTFGRFEVLVNEKPVQFTRKAQEKPMALLKAIVALGGRKVPSANIADALWPESDGATAQQSFATTLHRLRRIINVDDALIYSQGMVSLNPRLCWVDSWAVERAMSRIAPLLEENIRHRKDQANLSHEVEPALELYRGHFLSHDSHESWSIAPRERLRSRYIRNLTKYCTHLQSTGEHRKAVNWYSKALELENLEEELYQGLMLCYHEIGRKADALATYKRCRQVLGDVLGVEPSPETEKIMKTVLKGI
jgi:ATP/maltotriose-dependent transcriptional regulator MalT/DNA-binding SARP family transcriptional activator